jgi:ribosomal protein S18 acetylase RimI-like enzyme
MNVTILKAELSNAQHASDLVMLLDSYASDPMGGGEALTEYCRNHLIQELQKRPAAHAFLLYADGNAAAFSITIEGFSTFACKALLNIHDFAVHPDFRGHGLGKQLMQYICRFAQEQDYCKITLEVLEGNHPARALYAAEGFAPYALDPAIGGALMLQKKF